MIVNWSMLTVFRVDWSRLYSEEQRLRGMQCYICILDLQQCPNHLGKTNAFDWRKSLLAGGSQCSCYLIFFFGKKVGVKTFELQTGEIICVNDRRVDCWVGWIDLAFCSDSAFFCQRIHVFGLWWGVFSCCPFNSLHGVYVEGVVHLQWVRNGNKSWHGTADFFSTVLHIQLSVFLYLLKIFGFLF